MDEQPAIARILFHLLPPLGVAFEATGSYVVCQSCLDTDETDYHSACELNSRCACLQCLSLAGSGTVTCCRTQ